MEKEFTSDDFAKMQQQAIRRVKEMQQRSKNPEEKTGQSVSQGNEKLSAKPNDSSTKQPKLQMKKGNERPRSMLSSLFNMDSDVSLILPLLLLMGKEGNDDMLLLALLYIMA